MNEASVIIPEAEYQEAARRVARLTPLERADLKTRICNQRGNSARVKRLFFEISEAGFDRLLIIMFAVGPNAATPTLNSFINHNQDQK